MAQVKAKALTTIAGSYGRALAGDEIILNDKHAKQLEDQGLIEITGDAPDDEDGTPKSKGVRVTDKTGNAEKAEGDTNPKNPTGQKVAAEKHAANEVKQAPQKAAQEAKKATKKGK